MTTRYTNAEWKTIIDENEGDIDVPQQPDDHTVPGLLAPEFNKTIDHTLLKPDARTAQIDELCAEARTHGFAVSG